MDQQGNEATASRTGVDNDDVLAFGPFRLVPAKRLLVEGSKPVTLGGRAFDVLMALVSRAGSVVTHETLVAHAWPGLFVERGALRVHIAALRKALGDGQGGRRFIVNAPGRGYSFVAEVATFLPEDNSEPTEVTAGPSENLPALLTPMFGRERIVEALMSRLSLHRFVTIVGPGGIGKTTVALAVAGAVRASYRDGVRFLDLAPIADPALVPSALASALGQPVNLRDPGPALVAVLREKAMLLVLDNCDHVVEVAASLAEEICKGAPHVHILATSRESLRARGEHIHRLRPLETPPVSSQLTATEALAYPAVQLFVERAAAALDSFQLTDANASQIAEICRRLDGIALAIELAAGRVDTFGVGGVAARLDDRFRLLTQGLRTAMPHHQTLNATFDWSFQVLAEPTRKVFRRLSVLAGEFNLDAAVKITSDDRLLASDVVEQLATLVSASLVAANVALETASYRLLESARAYARGKLDDQEEFDQVARRHAEYFRDEFLSQQTEAARTSAEWNRIYGRQIENLRVALDWASSAGGDRRLAVELTVAGIPAWEHLSLNEECRSRVETALGWLDGEQLQDSRQAMQLYSALANSLSYRFDARSNMAWTRVLEMARALADQDYQLRAIRGLWTNRFADGDIALAGSLAEEFNEIARSSVNPADLPLGKRLKGMVRYYRGDLTAARALLAEALSAQATLEPQRHLLRYRLDQQTVTGTVLCKVLWLNGFPDRALQMADAMLSRAKDSQHALTVLDALAYSSCHLALLVGDLEAADAHITELLSQAVSDPQGPWSIFGRCWRGVLLSRQGNFRAAAQQLAGALAEMPEGNFLLPSIWFRGEMALAVGRSGETAQALAEIGKAIALSTSHEERWCLAELVRFNGEIILMGGEAGSAEAAEREFQNALALARRQGALSWELRAAISLARLRIASEKFLEAREILEPTKARFREGFATSDFVEATALLEGMS